MFDLLFHVQGYWLVSVELAAQPARSAAHFA